MQRTLTFDWTQFSRLLVEAAWSTVCMNEEITESFEPVLNVRCVSSCFSDDCLHLNSVWMFYLQQDEDAADCPPSDSSALHGFSSAGGRSRHLLSKFYWSDEKTQILLSTGGKSTQTLYFEKSTSSVKILHSKP